MHFIEYLKGLKRSMVSYMKQEVPLRLHIILGNESCDLDSMVSSLTLAYHYSTLEKYKNTIVIPVLNKCKELFPIRVENLYMLKKHKISEDWLIFNDTIPLETLGIKDNVGVTLVDHHVLRQTDYFLKPKVSNIIDHRPIDSSEFWDEDVEIDIQLVGSCSTIIATYLDISKNTLPHICGLLYDVITYDTIGFQESAGKVKPLDLEVAGKLEEALSIPINNTEYRIKLFDEIFQAHSNISHLTTEQLLYKDLKIIGLIHIPGLPMLVQEYFGRCDMQNAIETFCESNKVHVLIIMGLNVKNDIVERDLAVHTNEETHLQNIGHLLVSKFNVTKKSCALGNTNYYIQNDSKLSRKQLIPLLQTYLFENQ